MRGFSAGRLARIVRRTRAFDRARATGAAQLTLFLSAESARAEEALRGLDAPSSSVMNVASIEGYIFGITILLVMLLVTAMAVLYRTARRRWTRRLTELEGELARTSAKLDRTALILRSEPQIVVSWDRPDAEPTIEGSLALIADVPSARRILGYASWLEPVVAAQVEEATDRLLNHGEAFSIAAVSLRGHHLEISGRPVSGNAVMRIRDVSGDRLQLALMRETIRTGRRRLQRASSGAENWPRFSLGGATPRDVWCGATRPTLWPSKRPAMQRPSITARALRPGAAPGRRRRQFGMRGLEAPRQRRRQWRAPNLRRGRSSNSLWLGRAWPTM